MSEWLPIDSAPRVAGKQILVTTSDGWCACVGWRQFPDGTSVWELVHHRDGTVIALAGQATHWMPLPEPPK